MKLISLSTMLIIVAFSIPRELQITAIYTGDEGLPNPVVRVIHNDPTGAIWIGSREGAAWMEHGQWKIDSQATNPVRNGVSSIYQDSKGRLWFGGLGMCHVYDGEVYQTYHISEDMALSGRVVFSFHEDEEQQIWAATTGGVSIFNGETWTPFAAGKGLNNPVIHDINQDQHGNLWFATRKGGLNIYDGTDWEYRYPTKNCRKILRDDVDNLWVGSNDGLIKFDGEKWEVFEEGKTVLPMFKDKKGFIWCVASGKDILRVSSEGRIIHYENPTKGQANELYHLEYGQDGSVWAGSDQGIFVFH